MNQKKYMFVSDIHGNVDILQEIIRVFERENADKLVILGDTSASNSLDNEEIASMLNEIKSKIEIIRGNCDNLMLEERLDLPMYDTDNLYIGENVITITHGHHYNMYDLPPYCGNIFIQGHTHVPLLKEERGMIIANPGSPTRPRGTDLRCYLMVSEKEISLKTLDGKVVKTLAI